MPLHFKTARKLVGLPDDFVIRTQSDYDMAARAVVDKIVEARKNNDDPLAAQLSEAKALFKKRFSKVDHRCPTCGGPKYPYANECQDCSWATRHQKGKLNTVPVPKHYEIRSSELIPEKGVRMTDLNLAMRKLKDGQVGDSFTTPARKANINIAASKMGVQVEVRALNGANRDDKNRYHGVWRTDGLPLAEVNRMIAQRQNQQKEEKEDAA